MKKVAIVSCDKWIDKLEEDKNLLKELSNLNIEAKIVSWQKELEKYDMLILRSVWGYQNEYEKFVDWLELLKTKKISILNDVDMIENNIKKNIQFDILKKNNIDYIDTQFVENINNIELSDNQPYVIKPSISGSGENTYIVNCSNEVIPNKIDKKEILNTYKAILENKDCQLMIQPYIKEINNGEYSCIFVDGTLTHTMLRFPNIFHEKKRPYLIKDVPEQIISMAKKVESIEDFNGYLYMRVDMVMVDNQALVMEVELADPDLLTKYITDSYVKENVIKTLAKSIERRIR